MVVLKTVVKLLEFAKIFRKMAQNILPAVANFYPERSLLILKKFLAEYRVRQ